MKSFAKPTSEQVQSVAPLLSSPQHERYFFERLDNPEWIIPLREHGFFGQPPAVEQVEGGGVRYVTWPASGYLARMAKHAPKDVAAMFAEIKTDNPCVLGDMITATFDMPVDVAKTLVPGVCRAARAGVLWVYFGEAAKLCMHLAKGGEESSAMMLAEALFTPRFEKGREEPVAQEAGQYRIWLKQVLPILVARRAKELMSQLCEWLKAVIEAKEHVDTESKSDYSYVWRPAIEEHDQNEDYDFASAMVGFVREGFDLAVWNDKITLDEAMQILDGQHYLAFKRIRVHLINKFAEQNRDLARQIMMDHDLFDDYQYKHEYAMLVGSRFSLLEPQERDRWFSWIGAGPGKGEIDPGAREEVRQAQIRWWQYERLYWVRDHLQGRWRELYLEMQAEHGEPEMADMNLYVGPVRMGSDSPMGIEDLKKLSFAEAVGKVASWKPDKPRFMGPDIEGLALTFGEYVGTAPSEFSRQAEVLIDRPAIYVRGFISKMAEAVREGKDVDVLTVLQLCRWVLTRPVAERTTPEQEGHVLVDKDWRWTRDQLSEFVQMVCQSQVDGKPRYPLEDLREAMWAVLDGLMGDPLESYMVRDLGAEDPRVHDYLDMGINSPRGKAVRAAMEYARWVANHVKQDEVIDGGFGVMPEVRQMLESQIAPENRSVGVMSIIGAHTRLIYWIDKAWLGEHATAIFDLESTDTESRAASGWSAWNAFLVWNRPHIELYRLLKEQFGYAVRQAAEVEVSEDSPVRPQPMYRLGEYLVIFYGRRQLGLDDDDGLLRRFLSESIPDIRRHAVGFVGDSLKGDQRLPDGVVERFRALWDWYWSARGQDDAREKPNTPLFGPWFACGRFPDQWAIEQLEQFVQIAPSPEPDEQVVERLAQVSQTDISLVMAILDRMVRADKEGWRVHGWRDSVKTILAEALGAGGDARERAERLIDHLGRRGFTELGKLLRG
jgi:hypothetical protein